MQANSDKLELLTNNLNQDFDVFALSETWTSDNNNLYFEVPYLQGYQLFHGVKGKTLKSGCGFYLKSGTKFKPRKDLDISYFDENNEFQSCWIETLHEKQPHILIGVYYRHPKRSSNEIFLEKLNQNLQKIKNLNKHVLICRDFNYDLLRHEQIPYVNEFLNTMYSNFLQTSITQPTRALGKSMPTFIDNIFVNTYDKKLFAGNFLDKVSDHLPNFLIINDIKNSLTKRKIVVRDFKKLNKQHYLQDITELNNIDLLHVFRLPNHLVEI